jgi:hypothetical protein
MLSFGYVYSGVCGAATYCIDNIAWFIYPTAPQTIVPRSPSAPAYRPQLPQQSKFQQGRDRARENKEGLW